MICESSGTAVEAGAPVVITGCADVPFTEGEVALHTSIEKYLLVPHYASLQLLELHKLHQLQVTYV